MRKLFVLSFNSFIFSPFFFARGYQKHKDACIFQRNRGQSGEMNKSSPWFRDNIFWYSFWSPIRKRSKAELILSIYRGNANISTSLLCIGENCILEKCISHTLYVIISLPLINGIKYPISNPDVLLPASGLPFIIQIFI